MRPIELYRFTQGGNVFTYTSADEAVVYNAETYAPTPIGRSNIDLKNELSKANIDVRMPLTHAQALNWMKRESEASVGLSLFQQSDIGTNIIWKGRMVSVKPQLADVVFQFESIFTSLRRPGLRARYQRPCRHVLYRRGCTLDKDAFAFAANVTAANGSVVTIPAAASAPAGDFFTGMLEAPDGTFRFIVGHSGATITLQRPVAALAGATTLAPVPVVLYPGCDRTSARCKNRFNNLPNFGGFKYIPIRNPFDGSSIA